MSSLIMQDLEYLIKSGLKNKNFKSALRYLSQFICIKISDIVLVHSNYMKSQLRRFNISSDKIKICPAFVDHQKFNLEPLKINIRILYLKIFFSA